MSDSNNEKLATAIEPEAKNEELYKNLINQVEAIYKHTNEKSHGSRKRYLEVTKRFCRFTADEFKSQKFANTQPKHIRSYVEHLYENGASGSTVRTELSGIRFFYERSGGKNRLPDNKELNLAKRKPKQFDRSFVFQEIKDAYAVADRMGRTDVKIYIRISLRFGLRIEEAVTLRVDQVAHAIKYGQLEITNGKGGQARTIPVETDNQKKCLSWLSAYD